MKKIVFAGMFVSAMLFSASAFADCYTFSDSKDLKVCVKGDSFDDRKKAQAICKKAKGSDCGKIQSRSSSCNGKCVDENGNQKSSLSGY